MKQTTARLSTIALVTGIALVCATASPAQGIYRWVDAAGVIHFSDTPPQTDVGTVQTVDVEVSAPAPAASRPERPPADDTATWRPPDRADG